MAEQTAYLNGDTLWTALQKANAHLTQPALCLLRGTSFKLSIISDLRLAASWQTLRRPEDQGDTFFLIPVEIAKQITEQIRRPLQVRVDGNRVTLTSRLVEDTLKLRWVSDPSSLQAPPQFAEMLTLPKNLVEVGYVPLSDAVHYSVSKLAKQEAEQLIHRNKLAILVSLQQGELTVDGREIARGELDNYYFDPRLITRSLELLNTSTLRLGLTKLGLGSRAILSIVGEDGEWTTHCALLSIGLDTQRLYPLPPRQTPEGGNP
jgi:hypothetical protein